MQPQTCYFCGKTVESQQAAIDADWIPAFWKGDEEVDAPVCPECCDEHLKYDEENDEFVQKQ